jgi:YVTN family beta-propeller protein
MGLVRLVLPFALAAIAAAAAGTPSPALLVVNREGSLEIVDPATRQLAGRVRVGDGPREVAVSTDGKLAFVSNFGSDTPGCTISVIDLVAQTESRRVDLGPLRRPHGLAFAGGKLYFTAEANQLIGAYDPASGKVDWLFGTGQSATHMILVSPDANRIFTANTGSDSIGMIERTGILDWRQTVIPAGKGPEGFDVSPDGKQVWVANARDGNVSVIDIASRRVVHTFAVGTRRSNRLKFTPDGKLALITDADAGNLLVLQCATRREVKRVNLGRNPAGLLATPNSSKAYVAVTGDNSVVEIDLETLALAARIPMGGGPVGVAWAVR